MAKNFFKVGSPTVLFSSVGFFVLIILTFLTPSAVAEHFASGAGDDYAVPVTEFKSEGYSYMVYDTKPYSAEIGELRWRIQALPFNPFLTTDKQLQRYLADCKWKVQCAFEKIDKTAMFRYKIYADKLIYWKPSQFLKKHFPIEHSGYTKEGNPIFLIPLGRWNFRQFFLGNGKPDELFFYFVRFLEQAHQIATDHMEHHKGIKDADQAVLLIDAKGYKFMNLFSQKATRALRRIIGAVIHHYPYAIRKVFIVNAPVTLQVQLKLVLMHLTAPLKSTYAIYNGFSPLVRDELFQILPTNSVPVELGGTYQWMLEDDDDYYWREKDQEQNNYQNNNNNNLEYDSYRPNNGVASAAYNGNSASGAYNANGATYNRNSASGAYNGNSASGAYNGNSASAAYNGNSASAAYNGNSASAAYNGNSASATYNSNSASATYSGNSASDGGSYNSYSQNSVGPDDGYNLISVGVYDANDPTPVGGFDTDSARAHGPPINIYTPNGIGAYNGYAAAHTGTFTSYSGDSAQFKIED